MLLGFLLGLGAGFGSACLADMMNHKVRGSRDIESLLHQTPIAMIPFIDSPGDIVTSTQNARALIASRVDRDCHRHCDFPSGKLERDISREELH